MASTAAADQSPDSRPHLAHLDGIRGLASLYVVVFHLMMTQDYAYHLPEPLFYLTSWLRYGHYAVDVFIVLSGYCLMLPLLRRSDRRLQGGNIGFFIRRAWRIFPPYWAALFFTLAMILLSRALRAPVRADDGTAFDPLNLVAHVLMIHNWFPQYAATINLPMWTVAVEWQIYFVFALLLLPIWRRCGIGITMLAATLIGQLPRWVLPESFSLDWMCPWFIGLFSFGMFGALMQSNQYATRSKHWPVGFITAALAVIVIGIECIGGRDRSMDFLWAKDVVVGLATASFLIWCGRREQETTQALFVSILQSRPLVCLGAVSYSLYLIHLPMMWVVKFIISHWNLSPLAEFAFRLTVAPLLILPIALVFFLCFERPVLSRRARKRQDHEISNITPTGGAEPV